MPAMEEVRADRVDGVTTFWVDTGRPTLQASLVFRSGRADEPLHESGWLHLLEHLALEDRAAGALQVNGSVSALTTSFDFHGPVAAVSRALRDLTAWLSDPRLDRVEHEREVLAAESAWRGSSPLARALGWRFGAVGPGVMSYVELGLTRATPELLAARAARVFTTGNAVLVLDGPPPPGLRLTLPTGSLLAPAEPEALEPGPGAYGEGVPTATGLVPRDHAAVLAVELARAAVEKRLRHSAPHVYTVVGHYEQVSRDVAVLGLSAEAQDKSVLEVVRGLRATLTGLAATGPDRSALEDLCAVREQSLLDPANAVGHAYRAAFRHLEDKPVETLEEVLRDMRSVSIEDVGAVLRRVEATLLLGTPDPDHAQLPVLADRRQVAGRASKAGRRWRSVNAPSDRSLAVLDEQALLLHDGDGGMARPLDDLAAYLVMPHDYRSLVGRDGFVLNVDPTAWRHGDRLIAALDDAVDPRLHVPRALDDEPAPFPRERRASRWLGAALRPVVTGSAAAFAAFVLAGAVLAVVVASTFALALPLYVGLCIGLWNARRTSRRSDRKGG